MAFAARPLPTQFQLLELKPELRRPALLPPPPDVTTFTSEEIRRLRKSLEGTIAAKMTNGTELIRALDKERRDASIPTTLHAFDTLMDGGLPRGKLVELVSRRAAGRFSIALAALAAATSMGEATALIDLGGHFDPQLAEACRVDLRRLLWIRPHTVKQAVMSAEMIAATGFQLVIVEMGLHPLRGRRAPDAAWVRLARAAAAHGSAMLVSSPYPLTGTASEAVVKGCGMSANWIGRGNAPRLLAGITIDLALEKHRHRKPGTHTSLSLTDLDRQSSDLPAPVRRLPAAI